MADRLLKSLKALAEEKRGLVDKERQLKQVERQLIESLGRLLSGVGYRLVSLDGRVGKTKPRLHTAPTAKRIRCPQCDRRFGRPLHLARHMSAIHQKKTAGKRRRRTARTSP
jgi:hypothetical protein